MIRTLCLTLVVSAVLSVYFAGVWTGRPSATSGKAIWTTGPTVTHLESLGQLVAAKVYVSDVLIAEDKGYRGSWLIKGDALLSIDLSRAKVLDLDNQARSAKISLPEPKVLSPRVDHERTRAWSVEKTTWVPWRGDGDALRDEAMLHAQRLVEHSAGSKSHTDQAKATAAKVIESIYRMVEWDVVVNWESSKKTE